MSSNETLPSPHTAPSADEWLATWIAVFGMFFVLCIFLSPWLFLTDDPFGFGWAGAPPSTVVRYVQAVPIAPAAPVPPPSYQKVTKSEPMPVPATAGCVVPDLSRLAQGARNNAPGVV